jgi:serine protease Do
MKTLVGIGTILLAFNINVSTAQSKQQETIILQDSKGQNEIEIEIQDGEVYIDGKKVAPYNLNRNLKIIKKFGKGLGGDIPEIDIQIQDGTNGNNDQATENKPMLGVRSTAAADGKGALVESITANSAAAKGGLREKDVITKVDNAIILNPEDLANAINNYKPGDKVNIRFEREGKEMEEQITLLPRSNEYAFNPQGFDNMEDMMQQFEKMFENFGSLDGMNLKSFDLEDGKGFGAVIPNNGNNPKLGAQVEERADGKGLRVVSVSKESAAEKAGIMPEDILINYGGKSINDINDLSIAMKNNASKKEVAVEIMRGGKLKTVYLPFTQILRKKDF